MVPVELLLSSTLSPTAKKKVVSLKGRTMFNSKEFADNRTRRLAVALIISGCDRFIGYADKESHHGWAPWKRGSVTFAAQSKAGHRSNNPFVHSRFISRCVAARADCR